jgi:adenosylcobinamide-GDP ribazoletransferase
MKVWLQRMQFGRNMVKNREATLRWNDLKLCLVFLTRLPLHLDTATQNRSLAQAATLFPVVGIFVGLVGAFMLFMARTVGIPELAAAALCLTATILLTGALHEDGLADVADGFGGGLGKARKLEIMRDSRIGSYGVLAIGLSLILRVTLIAGITGHLESFWELAGVLVTMHAIGRGLLPAVMAVLPLARSNGLAVHADRPSGRKAAFAFIISLLIAVICLGPAAGISGIVTAAIAVAAMTWLARRLIGGYTGDVLGASEQIGEIVALAMIAVML